MTFTWPISLGRTHCVAGHTKSDRPLEH